MDRLRWGLKDAVPDTAEVAWGARAIFERGHVDLLPDRQSTVARTDCHVGLTRRNFVKRLNGGPLDEATEEARRLYEEGKLDGGSSAVVVLYRDEIVTIAASPRSSYGYLYIAAWR